MKLPKARSADLVVQDLRDEILVYDLADSRAFCLNETSAKVFNFCDGVHTFDELKTKYKFTDDLIYLALDQLKNERLIDESYDSPITKINRREVIKRAGLTSVAALPLITGLIVPAAVQGASVSCRAANTNVCAGQNGQKVSYITFNSTNGTCSGGQNGSGQTTCGATPVNISRDYIITASVPI